MPAAILGANVWYLYHSGFAVQTSAHFLIFDYYIDTPAETVRSLSGGVIDPNEIKDKKVLVFSSHKHSDHFNAKIFEWEKRINKISYILSNDIRSSKISRNICFVSPGNQYRVADAEISVLRSTDAGVAFLVCVDGMSIYHAGDLNWWHWEGEPEKDNIKMENEYKKQIDSLTNKQIDIAFVPVDPRLEKQYLLGLDYIMKTANVKTVFPMHFGSDFSVFSWIKKDSRASGYLDKIKIISHRGEKFVL